jgi:hypothetical protein
MKAPGFMPGVIMAIFRSVGWQPPTNGRWMM